MKGFSSARMGCALAVAVCIGVCLSWASVAESSEDALTVDEKVRKLNELTIQKPMMKFDEAAFTKFARTAPRNYSMIVMLTALNSRHQCGPCRFVSNEFSILAESWLRQQRPSKMYFASIDYDNAPGVFQKLDIKSVPVIMHFPARGKPTALDTYQIMQMGFEADNIAKFVVERTGEKIVIYRPPDYAGMLFVAAATAGCIVLAYLFVPALWETMQSARLWGFLATAWVILFLSGQMWNQIRGPPFASQGKNGEPIYIHWSSQSQFVAETWLVYVLYALTSGCLVMLIAYVPKQELAATKRISAFVFGGLFFLVLSILFLVFRTKNRGYPFRLLL
eukprot:Opistho-2@5222